MCICICICIYTLFRNSSSDICCTQTLTKSDNICMVRSNQLWFYIQAFPLKFGKQKLSETATYARRPPVENWVIMRIFNEIWCWIWIASEMLRGYASPANTQRNKHVIIMSKFYNDVCLLGSQYEFFKCYGDLAFFVAGPTLWNALPKNTRLCATLAAFKTSLKTPNISF